MPSELLSAREVQDVPYVELLARLGESNRPPGGLDTIRRWITSCHLHRSTTVLHAGCNAGFVSREIARRVGCRVHGIDLSPTMVEAATTRAAAEGLEAVLTYEQGDMFKLKSDNLYDVVLSDGALAFVSGDKNAAVERWVAVAKPHGLIADAEFFYHVPPTHELLQSVSLAIGVPVRAYDEGYWRTLFESDRLEPYYDHVAKAGTYSERQIERYCRRLISFSNPFWQPRAEPALLDRLEKLFSLFNENLRHMSYIVVVRRTVPQGSEPALFI